MKNRRRHNCHLVAAIFIVLSLCIPAVAPFQESVTYTPTVTPAERTAIHAQVEALAGDVGDAVVGDGSYDPLTLVGAMLDGSGYDSISRGSGGVRGDSLSVSRDQ